MWRRERGEVMTRRSLWTGAYAVVGLLSLAAIGTAVTKATNPTSAIAVTLGVFVPSAAGVAVYVWFLRMKRRQLSLVRDEVSDWDICCSVTRMPDLSQALGRLSLPTARDHRNLVVSFDRDEISLWGADSTPRKLSRIPWSMVESLAITSFDYRFRSLTRLDVNVWNGREKIPVPLYVNGKGKRALSMATGKEIEGLVSSIDTLRPSSDPI
jgi:hypothetical protein